MRSSIKLCALAPSVVQHSHGDANCRIAYAGGKSSKHVNNVAESCSEEAVVEGRSYSVDFSCDRYTLFELVWFQEHPRHFFGQLQVVVWWLPIGVPSKLGALCNIVVWQFRHMPLHDGVYVTTNTPFSLYSVTVENVWSHKQSMEQYTNLCGQQSTLKKGDMNCGRSCA
ncbi:hypothetical protein BV25DRAFT_1158132 [Artomyces pyxidatus]|uniref:Uncharacterized protein n=1 Tax=Artomyces pyxidatus TaxID=48021 RepID=A0ACB8SSW0_9AGAM|nr:hypothetical protein BV25DRAFT_1158132 [Artomyces pyxidatus]